MNKLNKIIIVCGATASGKTSLAIKIAKYLKTEIISADSVSIYKELNIGSAKPTLEECNNIKHHLIDVAEPYEEFTVVDFKNLATQHINNIINQSKIPIICGGTGFYINSILYDFYYGNSKKDDNIREYYSNLAKIYGNFFVFNILKELDSESAKTIHSNDLKRVIRALEIYLNGNKKSKLKNELIPKYNYICFMMNYERDILHNRIKQRIVNMFNNGFISEVEQLFNKYGNKYKSLNSIGYKEVLSFLNKQISYEEMINLIYKNTCQYAKRQQTFFKKYNNVVYINDKNIDNIQQYIDEFINT